MRLLTIFLLLALPLFGKQSERYYQEKFAREIGGQVEVVMRDGTRCDILTATHAIEVDFARSGQRAIGQSLHYSMLTGKRPVSPLAQGRIDRTFLVLDNRMHGRDGRRVSNLILKSLNAYSKSEEDTSISVLIETSAVS